MMLIRRLFLIFTSEIYICLSIDLFNSLFMNFYIFKTTDSTVEKIYHSLGVTVYVAYYN